MQYCPFCSASVSESAKTCHNCKKLLDIGAIQNALIESDESELNQSVLRSIWIKEHMRFVWPGITLLLGLLLGGIIVYGYSAIEFSAEKEELNAEISNLESTIAEMNNKAASAKSGLQGQLDSANVIIDLLSKERQSLTSIINFTRRFASNSAITPNSADAATSFARNFRYLQGQFEDQQEKLQLTSFKETGRFNIKTIPQFLEE